MMRKARKTRSRKSWTPIGRPGWTNVACTSTVAKWNERVDRRTRSRFTLADEGIGVSSFAADRLWLHETSSDASTD